MWLCHTHSRMHKITQNYVCFPSVITASFAWFTRQCLWRLPSSEIWRYVFWYTGMDVSGERAPGDAEGGGSKDLWSFTAVFPCISEQRNHYGTKCLTLCHLQLSAYLRKVETSWFAIFLCRLWSKTLCLSLHWDVVENFKYSEKTFGLFSSLKETLSFILLWFPYRSALELSIWFKTTYFP